ncbi:MAG: NCS1 family nucleobase:cation symporter-1 [Saprospiraceae bacterium]|nr:NCS1 family nucleobase:cation symporter-1 [Saprospiraceae bacterium]
MEDIPSEIQSSPLYSEDLAPIPVQERTWGLWDMTAIWVGMAVCIPTYLLASYMIKGGLNWLEALIIIALGNLIITIPMVLNGHAGVKYGIPFPVIGRAAFGTKGIHIAAVVRGIVACGWFGIQTWIGGLAFYAIWHAINGTSPSLGLDFGKFIGFALFWMLNVYFIWKGTESIKWLEKFAAPILIAIGIGLIAWGASAVGSFGKVLDQSEQLGQPSAVLVDGTNGQSVQLFPIKNLDGTVKATEFNLVDIDNSVETLWQPLTGYGQSVALNSNTNDKEIVYRNGDFQSSQITPSVIPAKKGFWGKIWIYLLSLTAMVGFWATMAISIADITRFTSTQKNQILGQFIGLPGTMALFSFVGIFVTCAAVVVFPDILIADDAPWDPVSLVGKFSNPLVVIIAQIFMIIATLSTNIAANVIAPANAFSNIIPTKISFRSGGIITAIIGILICPWWIMNEISGLLVFVSGLLGPVLGILICDYFMIRDKHLEIDELFKVNGIYSYNSTGFNRAAMIALTIGVGTALIGYWVPSLNFLYTLSCFTGFFISFSLYYLLMKKTKKSTA